jgi:hypothetical protein
VSETAAAEARVWARAYSTRVEPRLQEGLDRWREDRLQTGLLPAAARRWAFVGLAVVVCSGAFILAIGEHWGVPGGSILYAIPNAGTTPVPLALILFTYLALAALGGVVTVAARHEGWRLPFLARVCVAFVGAALAAGCVTSSDFIVAGSGANPHAIRLLGWIGVATACAAALLPPRAFGHRHEAAALLGGSPFLLALACSPATAPRAATPARSLPRS